MAQEKIIFVCEDHLLVEKIQKDNCKDSILEIIKRHTPICVKMIKKYTPAMVSIGVYDHNIYKEINVLIYQSAISFNPEKKSKLSTWIANQTRYHCLNILNKKKGPILIDSQDIDVIAHSEDGRANTSHEIKDFLFNILDQMKDKRVKTIFNLRYFRDGEKICSWEKVASQMGVSTQTAINIHNKGKRILKKKLLTSDINFLDKI